jgi:hypothetical protein
MNSKLAADIEICQARTSITCWAMASTA